LGGQTQQVLHYLITIMRTDRLQVVLQHKFAAYIITLQLGHILYIGAVVMASSYNVLGDAAEYQEWLASQMPPAAPTAETEQADAKQQAQEIGDLPADIAQIVVHMEQQHAAAVLSAYQSLQRSRYLLSLFPLFRPDAC